MPTSSYLTCQLYVSKKIKPNGVIFKMSQKNIYIVFGFKLVIQYVSNLAPCIWKILEQFDFVSYLLEVLHGIIWLYFSLLKMIYQLDMNLLHTLPHFISNYPKFILIIVTDTIYDNLDFDYFLRNKYSPSKWPLITPLIERLWPFWSNVPVFYCFSIDKY